MRREDAYKQAAKLHPAHIMSPFDALLGLEGVDAIYMLCEVLSGDAVYMPTARKVFAGCIEQQILQEHNGYNSTALARRYGYSRKHVDRIIKNNK